MTDNENALAERLTRFDIRHPRHWSTPQDAVVLARGLTRDEVIQRRELSGDLVYRSGTVEIVPDPWWLFPWEVSSENSYARRALSQASGR
jgi:hypothetical protein